MRASSTQRGSTSSGTRNRNREMVDYPYSKVQEIFYMLLLQPEHLYLLLKCLSVGWISQYSKDYEDDGCYDPEDEEYIEAGKLIIILVKEVDAAMKLYINHL